MKLSHIDVKEAPVSERTQVGEEGDTYLGGNAFVYAEGGEVDSNLAMVKNQCKELMHHAKELSEVLKKNPKIEAWVVGKIERATTDLSDVTHYLDGMEYAKGGILKSIRRWWKKINGTWYYNEGDGWRRDRKFQNKSEEYEKDGRRTYKQVTRGYVDDKAYEYAKGGDVPIKIVNKGKVFDRKTYKAIYGDFDKDGIMNSDDPNPIKKGDKSRVEQLSFPKVFDTLLDTKKKLDSTMYDAVSKLKKITPDGGKIYARTKTPYSIINKLVDSRMIVHKNPKMGLTDMVGTTIVVDNAQEVFALQKEIEKGALGEIIPEGKDKDGNVILADNKYLNPKGGYKAIHYIILMDGIPVEVQLKTKRMKEVNEIAHNHYKAKNLNADYMEYLTSLADKADNGDKKAATEFSRIMRNKKDVSEKLKLDSTMKYALGGSVEEIYGDEADLDGIFEDFKD